MKIDVTNIDKVELVKAVYELSRPQGMGMMHFDPAPLTTKDVQSMIRPDGTIRLDYVKGRACKVTTTREGERFFFQAPWYDHTDEQLYKLLDAFGLERPQSPENHGPSCNCAQCKQKRCEAPEPTPEQKD